MTCTVQSLETAATKINALTRREKKAALILYLYRQKNPSTVGAVIPAASLVDSSKCIACNAGPSPDSSMLDAFEVAIQRQAAIDAGAAESSTDYNNIRKQITPLASLSESRLRAIEIWLRCQIA